MIVLCPNSGIQLKLSNVIVVIADRIPQDKIQHLKSMLCFEVNMLPRNKTVKQGNELNLREPVDMNSVECRNNGNCNLNELYELSLMWYV